MLHGSPDIKARDHYQKAVEKEPAYQRAFKNLGLLNIQQDEDQEGIANLSRAIELGNREAKTYGLLGFAFLNLGQSLPAEKAYSSAIILDPGNGDWRMR